MHTVKYVQKKKRTTRALRENVTREENRNLGTLSEVRNRSTTIYHGACYYITTPDGESTYFTGCYTQTNNRQTGAII